MRQSVAPSRISHAASLASQANNAAAISRLQEKKKEFEAVAALERASALFLKRIEGHADDCEVMADAGQVHGQVLEQWPLMFQTWSLFLNSREQHPADSSDDTARLTGERLVRIPLDELQTDVSKQSLPRITDVAFIPLSTAHTYLMLYTRFRVASAPTTPALRDIGTRPSAMTSV